MGLPIEQLVIGTNANDILHRVISGNDYSQHALQHTLSPSMDIMVSSNFERLLFDLYGRDGVALNQLMTSLERDEGVSLKPDALQQAKTVFASHRLDDAGTIDIIRSEYEASDYLLDPHSAIGVAAGRRCRRNLDTPMIALATAHPAKFPEAVIKAGYPHNPPLPHHMADLFDREERVQILKNDRGIVQQFIADNLRA